MTKMKIIKNSSFYKVSAKMDCTIEFSGFFYIFIFIYFICLYFGDRRHEALAFKSNLKGPKAPNLSKRWVFDNFHFCHFLYFCIFYIFGVGGMRLEPLNPHRALRHASACKTRAGFLECAEKFGICADLVQLTSLTGRLLGLRALCRRWTGVSLKSL